jgi:hypothetical protein
MRKSYCFLSSLLLFFVLAWTISFAGTTGKIRGVVEDINGEPLPGANITLVGTTMGASTSLDGEYIILLVAPGDYQLQVSMMGYKSQLMNEVKVEVDRTTLANFPLQEEVIEGETVVVQARRDLVRLDVSASETNIDAEEVKNIPFARRVEDMIGMQAGVSGNLVEGDLKIREGDYHESGVLVDGYSTTDGKSSRPSFPVNQQSIQEVQVLRGGFSAEYGEARSGLINIITKDPSNKFNISLDYRYDPVSNRHQARDRYDPESMWHYQLYNGPNSNDDSYIVRYEGITPDTLRWEGWNSYSEKLLNDGDPDNDLTAEEARELWNWRHRPIEYAQTPGQNIDVTMSGGLGFLPWRMNFLAGFKHQIQPYGSTQPKDAYRETDYTLKLINKITDDTRLTFTFLNSSVNTVSRDRAGSSWSNEVKLAYGGGDSEPFYPYRKPWVDRRTSLGGMKLVHVMSPTRYLEADVSFLGTYWDTDRFGLSPESAGRTFHGRLYLDPQAGYIPRENGIPDNVTGFQMFGGASSTDNSYSEIYNGRISYVDQFHSAHELKSGIDVRYSKLVEDRTHYHNDDPGQLFEWKYNVAPVEMSGYIQDKIEFWGMIANIGLRWDYYMQTSDRNDVHRALDYNTDADFFQAVLTDSFPKIRPKPQNYVSPRIGISFPITTNSKVYFNYGHFVQMPQTEALYSTTLDYNRPRVQWMGDATLTFQKAANFEIGYDQNVKNWFQLHVGAFYRDYSLAQSGLVYAHSDQTLVMELPGQREYRDIRGFDIEVRKSSGRFITGFFNYNITQKSVSNLEVPGISQIPVITDNPNLGINGELRGIPLPNQSEITPYGRGVITFSAPMDWGPRLSGYPIFERTRASFGLFYTGPQLVNHPDGEFRKQHPDVKFYTIPRMSTNLRLARTFSLAWGVDMEGYIDISNLWVKKYRTAIPTSKDYYDDLYANGKTDRVGSEEVSNPNILRTHSDVLYSGEFRSWVVGVRIML